VIAIALGREPSTVSREGAATLGVRETISQAIYDPAVDLTGPVRRR
jgi:hypothetical protein